MHTSPTYHAHTCPTYHPTHTMHVRPHQVSSNRQWNNIQHTIVRSHWVNHSLEIPVLEFAVCEIWNFLPAYGGDSRWLWLFHRQPLVMEPPSRGPWRSQSHLLFPPPGLNKGNWMCWNAKGTRSTNYDIYCLTTSWVFMTPNFKYCKHIFTCSWLKQILWWLDAHVHVYSQILFILACSLVTNTCTCSDEFDNTRRDHHAWTTYTPKFSRYIIFAVFVDSEQFVKINLANFRVPYTRNSGSAEIVSARCLEIVICKNMYMVLHTA